MIDTITNRCIFCKRSLTDQKIPVCHSCAQKGQNGFFAVAAIVGNDNSLFIKKKE